MNWDPRLTQRGATLIPADVQPGQPYWALTDAWWLDEQESQGKHHIFMEPVGLRCRVWNGGQTWAFANFPMFSAGTPYNIQPDTGIPADSVLHLGMGSLEQPYHTIHTSYRFRWEKRSLVFLPQVGALGAEEPEAR